jgi:hypothetical protein
MCGKSRVRKPLRRTRRKWEDQIRIVLGEVLCVGIDWIHIAQGGAQQQVSLNPIMNLRLLL